ncbi:MAG: ABC transporter substrate-binding protein [Deltaproteobacteria bacterium]|nr:ABC transporter substrate-binding protein [Deltaproteobacteria bacterium]
MIELRDDRGRLLRLRRSPRTLVSLVPSDTYTLLRLGGGGWIVGRTRYCAEPAALVAAIEVMGGTKDPDLARIVAARPELVLAGAEENRGADVEALERAGIPVLVGSPRTVAQGLAHAARLAQLLPERAARRRRLLDLARRRVAWQRRRRAPPVATLVLIWPEPLLAVGPDAFASDMLRLCGARNVLAGSRPPRDAPRYPRVDLAAIRRRRPELVLLPDEPYAFSDAEAERWRASFAAPATARPGSGGAAPVVARCDGRDLFWYGLRCVEGIERLVALVDAVRAHAA